MRAAVIVEPEKPENTGFIARLCENFGFELRLVKPGFNLEEARKTASRAQGTLREARIFEDLEEAVKDLDYVVGTKPGRGRKISSFTPRENTSVMIGRESSGLSNTELELCDSVVHIETAEYDSINQSHAAAIVLHSVSVEAEDQGIEEGRKEILEQLVPGSVYETIMEANPSRENMDRMIGELKD